MTENKTKPAPTREHVHSEIRQSNADHYTQEACEIFNAYADAKEAEIASLTEALRDMEIARWEAVREFRQHLLHYAGVERPAYTDAEGASMVESIIRCDVRLAALRAEVGEGGA